MVVQDVWETISYHLFQVVPSLDVDITRALPGMDIKAKCVVPFCTTATRSEAEGYVSAAQPST